VPADLLASSQVPRPIPCRGVRACLIASVCALVLLAACSPSLDWREVRPPGSGAALLMPCRPASHARELALAGARIKLTLHACQAAGSTWAVAWADVGDPARVGASLQELRQSVLANLGGGSPAALPQQVSGGTPSPQGGVFEVAGRLPDGQAVRGRLALAALGTRVLQFTALGPQPDAAALDTFTQSLRLAP